MGGSTTPVSINSFRLARPIRTAGNAKVQKMQNFETSPDLQSHAPEEGNLGSERVFACLGRFREIAAGVRKWTSPSTSFWRLLLGAAWTVQLTAGV